MKNYNVERNISFSVLKKEDVVKIHEASIKLLATVGMKVQGEKVLQLLQDNGCTIDVDGIVKFPQRLIEESLETVPKEVILYDRDKNPHMVINSKNNVYFGTHSDQLEIIDYKSDLSRPFLKEDTQLMCKIAQNLDNIDFVLSVGLSKDVDPKIQSVITFIETVKNFAKPINFSTNDIDTIQDIIDIASIVAGGKEELQAKPFIFNYCEPIPPLTHPEESTGKLYISAMNKIPVVYMPYCMMGGTSPIDKVTTLVQCNSEVLAGIVITQIINKGAPFIYGAMPSVFDQKTTIGSYAAPEFHLMVAAMSEMANYYQVPFYGTAGCSDSKSLDAQAFTEVTMELFSTLLSKANIIHDVGVMDHCNSVSPVMVVIADQIIEYLKYYNKGITIDSEIDLSIFEKVGHGGQFLNHKSTYKNAKTMWYPELFSRKMKNPDFSEVLSLAKSKIDMFLDTPVPALDPEILSKLVEIEKKYEQGL